MPYVVYTTGVGYRSDRVSDPSEGYQMLWNDKYAGKMGVIDDAGEALAMAMLAWDITDDINTADAPTGRGRQGQAARADPART